MSTPVDSKSDVEPQKSSDQVKIAYNLDEIKSAAEYKADAVEAENAEHNMGVLEAVRAYPMASFWAFVMSFTIVRYLSSSFPLTPFSLHSLFFHGKPSAYSLLADHGIL
jgi:hypothetical protein